MGDVVKLIDAKLLKVAAPETELKKLEPWVEPFRAACYYWGIDTVREIACFLGQGAHESKGFTDLDEDLSYSAERLCAVWPKRFPTLKVAKDFAHNPQRLANMVYANRLGNGGPETGDGYTYRGGGVFQLTGKFNQISCAKALRVAPADFPAYLRSYEGAAMSAGWYFREADLDRYAATPGVVDDTKAINGGTVGLADRTTRFDAVVKELLRRGA